MKVEVLIKYEIYINIYIVKMTIIFLLFEFVHFLLIKARRQSKYQ